MKAMTWVPFSHSYKRITFFLCVKNVVGTVSGHIQKEGQQHAWTGKTREHWGSEKCCSQILFSLLNYFGLYLFSLFFLCLFFFNQNPLQTETLNIYSSCTLVRQSCLCCTEESPLCISQLSINLERLPLFSKTIITCHDSLSVLISLSQSYLPFHPSHPPSQWMLKIVGCGM